MEIKITIPDDCPSRCKNCLIKFLDARTDEQNEEQQKKKYKPRTLSLEEKEIAKRFMALKTETGDTWEKVAKRLRLKGGRGSAHSLAVGRKKPTKKNMQMLEAAEFDVKLATKNLKELKEKK